MDVPRAAPPLVVAEEVSPGLPEETPPDPAGVADCGPGTPVPPAALGLAAPGKRCRHPRRRRPRHRAAALGAAGPATPLAALGAVAAFAAAERHDAGGLGASSSFLWGPQDWGTRLGTGSWMMGDAELGSAGGCCGVLEVLGSAEGCLGIITK